MNNWQQSDTSPPNPVIKANLFSKWFFRRGLRNELYADDLYAVVPKMESSYCYNELMKQWSWEELTKKPHIMRILFRTFGWSFVPICIVYSLLEITVHSFQPLFLSRFVQYFSKTNEHISQETAYLMAAGIVLCSLLSTLFFQSFAFYLFETATKVRLACAGLVYHKCLKVSSTTDNGYMNSYAIALLSADLPAFESALSRFYCLWLGPLEAIIFAVIIYLEAGWQAIVGFVAILCFLPLQSFAVRALTKYKFLAAEICDERIKLMNEIILAIQTIKMYAWEQCFAKLISEVRKEELRAIRGYLNVIAVLLSANLITKFSLFISLLTYIYTGHVVTSSIVFLLTSYHDRLNSSLLTKWINAVSDWSEVFVTCRRMEWFMEQPESPASLGVDHTNEKYIPKGVMLGRICNPQGSDKAIVLRNVSTSWMKNQQDGPKYHLENINFEVPAGHFLGIIGNVATGKSTLLHTLMGELEILNGYMEINGSISYASQKSWIFEGTIRENIIFMEPYDRERYNNVVHACDLNPDIKSFPYGDSTIVGELGITLSGGQKARINLARAIYKQADIYIFDDPLAAVDLKICKKLIDKCFNKFLLNKTRVLVTHTLHHLKHSNHIILMKDGRADVQGTYAEVKQTIRSHVHFEQENHETERPKLNNVDSLRDKYAGRKSRVYDGSEFKEQQMQGAVKMSTYFSYFKALHMPAALIVLAALFFTSIVCLALLEVFVSRWSTWEEELPLNEELNPEFTAKRTKLVSSYAALLVITTILYLGRTFGFFNACLRITFFLHKELFSGVIAAKMSFFNQNSSGRIVNRFSNDLSIVDTKIPENLIQTVKFVGDTITVISLVAVANYYLVIPAVISIILLQICRHLFLATNRNLKRIESLTYSPVFLHTNQTFQGLYTIRATNTCDAMEREFHYHQNNNTKALYLFTATNRAFAFWTNLIVVLYIAIVTYIFLWMDVAYYSGDVGLAITQSISLIIIFQEGVRETAELETNMISLERIKEFANTAPEPQYTIEPNNKKLSKDWPDQGHIEFKGLYMKYMPTSTNYILKDFNLTIQAKEKLGIVGRSGAGKSSIIMALFRLANNDGHISIDGHDIESVKLQELRSRISIIPQDPVLFSGTLRFNLDPFAQRTDEELWKAIEDAHLKKHIQHLDGGLDYKLYDRGSMFSMGQRQLICLARAILSHNRILIVDEPSTNVDIEMDHLLHETIHNKFKDFTVITIAHRLHTVMDTDRVAVIDEGRIVELAHPHELLQREKGFLKKIVEHADEGVRNTLQRLARKSYDKRVAFKTI